MVRSTGGPFYGRSAGDGLHVLKDKWFQRTYLAEQALEVLRNLDTAIEATHAQAPRRSHEQLAFRDEQGSRRQPGAMGHSKKHPGLKKPSQERLLESAIWQRYPLGRDGAASPLWRGLATVQYALFDKRKKNGWGHVDLLAVVKARPAIVELKGGHSKEPPLRPILEAVSYAVALRANWDSFLPHFVERVEQHGLRASADKDAPIPCIVLAPAEYWHRWSPTGTLGRMRPQSAWENLRALTERLAERGYPVRYGVVTANRLVDREVFDADSLGVEEQPLPFG
jgi:hypothetical protein